MSVAIVGREIVHAQDRDWMAYIEAEVEAVCQGRGWRHQIRRRWSVREKMVSASDIDDYEWKLIPDFHGSLPDAQPDDFEGVYYVLGFDQSSGRFVLQHDTSHYGVIGPHWEVTTYTEIQPHPLATPVTSDVSGTSGRHPPAGWLRDHLNELITRFAPNRFSRT